MSQAQIRILTVDDHPLLRAGIAGLISAEPDMVLVAEAETGRDAIEKITRHRDWQFRGRRACRVAQRLTCA